LLTSGKGVSISKCSEGLGGDHFYVHSPCDLLIESDFKVLLFIHFVIVCLF